MAGNDNKNSKKKGAYIVIIAMVSVLIMLGWGYAVPGAPSWLAVMAGGIGIVAVCMLMPGDDEKEDDDKQTPEEIDQQ